MSDSGASVALLALDAGVEHGEGGGAGLGPLERGQGGVAGQLGGGPQRVPLEPFGDGLERLVRRSDSPAASRQLGGEDRGGELGHRLALARLELAAEVVDLAGAHRPGGQHRAQAARARHRRRVAERLGIEEDLGRAPLGHRRVAECLVDLSAGACRRCQVASSSTSWATTRGVTSSGGSATPVRDRMTLRVVWAPVTTTGGPPLSASRTALALNAVRPLSAASLATCIACSKRSRVRIGRCRRAAGPASRWRGARRGHAGEVRAGASATATRLRPGASGASAAPFFSGLRARIMSSIRPQAASASGGLPARAPLPVLAEHGQHPTRVGLAAGRLDRPGGEAIAVLAPWLLLPAGPGDQPERHLAGRLGALAGVGVAPAGSGSRGVRSTSSAQPVERLADSPRDRSRPARPGPRRSGPRGRRGCARASDFNGPSTVSSSFRSRAPAATESAKRLRTAALSSSRGWTSRTRSIAWSRSSDSRTIASASRRPWPFPRPRRAARVRLRTVRTSCSSLRPERLIQALAGRLA